MWTSLKIKLTNQPYFLFLLTGTVLIVITLFLFGQSFDFHLHDTYFVVPVNYFIWALAGLFFWGWIIYKFTDKFLWTKKLIWIHVLTTLFLLILLSTISFWHDKILPPIKREAISYQDLIDDQKREAIIAYPVFALFALGQAAYLINLIVGLIKRRF